MDKLFLIIIISSAIILCLLIVNFINDKKESFLNHGGYFSYNKPLTNEYKLDCSKDKYKLLEGEKYSYSKKETLKLKKLSKKLIEKINRDLKLNFRFVELDFITKREFSDNNIRYMMEIFVYEIRYLYNRRIMLDVFIDNKNKKIQINRIKLLNGRKENPKKLKLYQFDEKILDKHFNNENDIKYDLRGLNDSKLEFNILNYKPKHINNKNFKEWIMPKEYLTILNQYKWPCRNQEEKWDENGINLTQKLSNNCKGINSSFNKNVNIPKFLPNFKNIDSNSNLNWLFNKFTSDGRDIGME